MLGLKRAGRFFKRLPWRRAAKIGGAVVGVDIPSGRKELPPPGVVERVLLAVRAALDVPIAWLESKRRKES